MTRHLRRQSGLLVILALAVGACAHAPVSGSTNEPQPAPPAAPWQSAHLAARDMPAVYTEQWMRAANRDSCALIAPRSLGDGTGATPRAATFAGGWAVAYDKGGVRSAFGVAGAGVKAADPSYHDWPHERQWADGSSVGYGPEGGTGPNQLAYLRIAGQGCLYNVWSRLGVEHLEALIEQLRFVELPAGP